MTGIGGVALTAEQEKFLATGTHEAITVSEHARMRKRAARLDRDWPPDNLLNWDGTLLPMSSMPVAGRVFVRAAGWKPAFRGGPKPQEDRR